MLRDSTSVEREPDHHDAVEAAISSIDELTAALVDQLAALRGRLRDSSAHDLADALRDLQDHVRELLATDVATMGPAALASLEAIAAATDRIERTRARLLDELSPAISAEAALRNWTGSTPRDGRIRPGRDT